MTGTGFPFYRGAGSRLQRALINLFLDIHSSEHGMTEIWPPAVVNADSARGTGQLPDKEDQMYVVTRDDLYLNPTAEVAGHEHPPRRDHRGVAAAHPLRRLLAVASGAKPGAAGRATRGILRVHQFDKVEMVAFERPSDSAATLDWLTERAEIVLQRLGLAYRVRLLSTGDMGFTQAKTYDLEVWAPGVQEWLEVSSVSNFRDFQARRMNIRWRPEPGAKPEILHTLNGSGLALPRTVAALLENYQQPDGSVALPELLASRSARSASGGRVSRHARAVSADASRRQDSQMISGCQTRRARARVSRRPCRGIDRSGKLHCDSSHGRRTRSRCQDGNAVGRPRGHTARSLTILRCGEVAERFMAAVLKTVDRKVRGFESLPLRQQAANRM